MSRKIAAVGSLAWVSDERSIIKKLEDQDVEDIAFAVRTDMDWLNEHMANIFERPIFDMAEIMKTPGRLRGKTPGKTPRTVRRPPVTKPAEEPLNDVFTENSAVAATKTPLSTRPQRLIAQAPAVAQSTPPPPSQPQFLPFNNSPQLQTPAQPPPTKSPVKSAPRKQLTPQKVDSPFGTPIKELPILSPPPPLAVEQIAPPRLSLADTAENDSGFFTTSQVESQEPRVSTGARTPLTRRQSRRTTRDSHEARHSFATAKEETSPQRQSSPLRQSSPAEDVALLGDDEAEEQEQPEEPKPKVQEQEQEPEPEVEEQEPEPEVEEPEVEKPEVEVPEAAQEQPEPPHYESPIKSPIKSPLKKAQAAAASEPRRSGRIAAISTPANHQSPVPQPIVPASPMKVMTEALMDTHEDEPEAEPVGEPNVDYPVLPETVPEPEKAVAAEEPPVSAVDAPGPDASFTTARSKSPELPPTPEAPVLRGSSMNFASLPAREPLTNKKKSLGAKAFRESQLDQVKQADSQRASWKKMSNGKSLGGSSRPIIRPEEEEKVREEEEEPERPRTGDKRKSEGTSSRWQKMSRGEDMVGVEITETTKVPTKGGDDGSDEELRLHNKTSTQRLHDKIQQLGKLNARTARSFAAPAQQPNLGYPDLSPQEPEATGTIVPKTPAPPQEKSTAMDVDVDSAVIGDTIHVTPVLTRSTRSKTESTPGGRPVQEPGKRDSPYRPTPIKTRPIRAGSVRNIDTSIFEKPSVALQSPINSVQSPPSPLKTVKYASINDIPQFAANKSLSPKKTPPADTTLSAVKAQTSSMIQKAKEMWMKSSATSESARIEGMTSPPPLRKWQGAESLQDVFKRDEARHVSVHPKPQEEHLYPDLGSVLLSGGKGKERELPVAPLSPAMQTLKEGRQTRNSRSRVEEALREVTPTPVETRGVSPKVIETEFRAKSTSSGRQTRNSKSREDVQMEAVEPQPAPPPAPKAKKSFTDESAELRAMKERQRRLEEILRQEKEDRKRWEQQRADEQRLKEPAPIIPTTREPAPEDDDEEMTMEEEIARPERPKSRFGSAEPISRPKSRLEQQRGMRFQSAEPKRVIGATKERPAAKPAPVAMKISTASQREMNDQQRMKHTINATGPSSTTLVSALKNSFEPAQPPAQTLTASHSSHSLKTSSSNGSLKSTASGGTTSTKQLRSLQSAASQRKKEQEEKEKKAAQKKEIERRRLENQRRLDEEHQKRMQAQRQKATTPGPSGKPLSRSNPQLRSTSQEPEANRGKPYGSLKGAPYGNVKRALPDREEEQPQHRIMPPRPNTAAASYHHDGAKKRRTNDYEEGQQQQQQRDRYEMPPPIRASMVKKVKTAHRGLVHKALPTLTHDKDMVGSSKHLTTHGHGYSSASSSSTTSTATKTSSSRPVPQVDGVKFSNDKIRFAGATPSSSAAAYKTPGNNKIKTPAGFKESPLYPNGDQIELPEIPTDSEDDDDYGTGKDFTVPQWAESPELRALLRQQQTIDPTQIFGPMAKLDMDAIFKADGKAAGRFRSRTSSANWGGADRLTQAEILKDQEERRKMAELGKWVPSQP